MNVGILGSGFGLYGYLPALVTGLGLQVTLPERYRPILLAREDIRALDARIAWVADEEAMRRSVDAIVVALRPADQYEVVQQIADIPGIQHVLLEKPVAPTPSEARHCLERLARGGKTVEVGYNFRFTDWSKRLAAWLAGATGDATLDIRWHFRAHHYARGLDNWKSHAGQGGGALRFYGIHLIALLAELGYSTVEKSVLHGHSPDDARSWSACLTGAGLPTCELSVDSDADEALFDLSGRGPALVVELRDPFDETPVLGGFDRRVGLLTKLCENAFCASSQTAGRLSAALDLWNRIELETECRIGAP